MGLVSQGNNLGPKGNDGLLRSGLGPNQSRTDFSEGDRRGRSLGLWVLSQSDALTACGETRTPWNQRLKAHSNGGTCGTPEGMP